LLNVLVTAIGNGGIGEQCLKALQLTSADAYRLFGADAGDCVTASEMVTQWERTPLAAETNYLDSLERLCEKWNIDVLIPGSEAELKVVSKSRERFIKAGVYIPINTQVLIDLCMDKVQLSEELRKRGFSVPTFQKISHHDDLKSIDWFPVVVKPSTGGKGSADVFIAQSTKQLLAIADYFDLSANGREFIVQEYVGTPNDEYTVSVLHDSDGLFVGSIALQRDLSRGLSTRTVVSNETGRKELGSVLTISSGISQGVIGRFPAVTEPCVQIADALKSQGPLNMQCRLHRGKVWVFEVNPRFSGTTSIRAMVGFNEIDMMIKRKLFPKRQMKVAADVVRYAQVERVLVERLKELPR
jgi:carbamoyl-phosphate synthase large subunit